jgi:hypothetical protein
VIAAGLAAKSRERSGQNGAMPAPATCLRQVTCRQCWSFASQGVARLHKHLYLLIPLFVKG